MIILYQIFLYESNDISFKVDDIISHQLDVKSDYVNSLVHGVIDNRDKIDELANKYLTDWDIYRLGFTDQAILRIAIYELMYTKYSDDKVSKMINGVLDKIYHSKVNNEQ